MPFPEIKLAVTVKKHGNVDIKQVFSCPVLFLDFVPNALPGVVGPTNTHSDIRVSTIKIVRKHHQTSIKLKNKANYIHTVNSVALFRTR